MGSGTVLLHTSSCSVLSLSDSSPSGSRASRHARSSFQRRNSPYKASPGITAGTYKASPGITAGTRLVGTRRAAALVGGVVPPLGAARELEELCVLAAGDVHRIPASLGAKVNHLCSGYELVGAAALSGAAAGSRAAWECCGAYSGPGPGRSRSRTVPFSALSFHCYTQDAPDQDEILVASQVPVPFPSHAG